MDGGLITTVVLFILLPGFLALKVIEGMTDPKSRSDLDKVGIALSACLVIYLVYLGLSYPLRLPHIPVRYEPDGLWPLKVNGAAIGLIVGLAILIGFLIGRVIDRGWMEKVNWREWITSRKLGGPSSEWVRALDENRDRWACVYFDDGRTLLGTVAWYSDDPDHRELFLGREYEQDGNVLASKVLLVDKDGEESEIDGPGVLVTHDAGVKFIAFLDAGEKEG